MIKAVIFDMFETLITHYRSPLYFGRQIAAEVGIEEAVFRDVWDTTDHARTLGKTTLEETIELVLKKNGRYSETLYSSIIRKRKETKTECFRHLHPEILPMLDALRASGRKIGLITNCYLEESGVIRESVLFPYFDAVCMSCELGMMKPDPAIYCRCMDELSVCPEECLYVGDGGSRELESARSLGMHPVQAVWYFDRNPQAIRNPAFVQAETPSALPGFLGKL
ncbi:MAG: HAD-IA family hydrolase [Clostridia bacterium]|nr:HAD-IA family hydrolase [Clostridia bacterium]